MALPDRICGLPLQVVRSGRKTVCIQVDASRGVILRAPARLSAAELSRLLLAREPWIQRKAEELRARPPLREPGPREELALRALAARTLPEKIARYGKLLSAMPRKVCVTGARTRFGSCSAAGTLCFSWRLFLYPEEAVDYVVVHELAHLIHPDHSPAFHACVASVLPDHQRRRALLRLPPVGLLPGEGAAPG